MMSGNSLTKKDLVLRSEVEGTLASAVDNPWPETKGKQMMGQIIREYVFEERLCLVQWVLIVERANLGFLVSLERIQN